ncbi:MAG: pilus assembly protein, partial [Planctomycetales bacterium]|nr:pilus assembly protein [Planctomycetales bacterium]
MNLISSDRENLRQQLCPRGVSTKRAGTTTIEFSLVLPVALVLIFAGVEFARISIVRHALDNASYEAARLVIVPGANVSEATAAAQQILNKFRIVGATVTVSPNPILDTTKEVTVTVNAPSLGNGWGISRFA